MSQETGIAEEAPPPAPAATTRPRPPRPRRVVRAALFLKRVYEKAGDDNIFFMAGAISFNFLVGIVPLLLFVVGVVGWFLAARFGDPSTVVLDWLLGYLPAIGGDIDLANTVESYVRQLIDDRTGFTLVGAFLLLWFSTRLVGTLRTVLREVFDVGLDRGIVGGKIFDMQVVLVGGALVVVNLGVTAALSAARDYGVVWLGLEGRALGLFQQVFAHALAFSTIWLLLLGVYRYLPGRRIPWRTALIAATFTAVCHELLKEAFRWYVTEVASYSTYGNLVTLAVLVFWIYYGAIVFILGGEVAQVWSMRRARKVRTRRILGGLQTPTGGTTT